MLDSILTVLFSVISSIRITRKSWHTLLNTCFHIAMTSAVFAGGITLTGYPIVCQAVSSSCFLNLLLPKNKKTFFCTHVCVCFRWGLFFTTPPCPLYYGSVWAPESSIKKLYRGLHSSLKARVLRSRPSGPCSGQSCHHRGLVCKKLKGHIELAQLKLWLGLLQDIKVF